MLAFVDTAAESSLIYGNPERFRGVITAIDGYRRQSIQVQAVPLTLGITTPYKVYVSPTPKYILGIDILAGMHLQTTMGEFHLQIWVVKAILRGHARHPPLSLPTPNRIVATKQYHLLDSYKGLGRP